MSNIGFFRPEILFPQAENTARGYLQKEREARLKKEEENLMLEFEKSLKSSTYEHKTEEKELTNLTKQYNLLHYSNQKKIEFLQHLKITAKLMQTKSIDLSPQHTFSSGSLKDMQNTLNSKNNVNLFELQELIDRLNEEIRNIELKITHERYTTEQLENMYKKEKEDFIYHREKFLDCKAINKGIDKYSGQIEDTKARAKNELIKANDTVSKLKTEIKKQSTVRAKKMEGIKHKEKHIKKEVEILTHRVAETAVEMEENGLKNEMLKTEYGQLLAEFENDKKFKENYTKQLEYYSDIFEKIKKIIKESKCLSIEPEKVDTFSPKDILKAFQQMLSIESRLQIRFLGLAAEQYELRQICDDITIELSELKEDPGLSSGNIQELRSRTRRLTRNETFEIGTYTGLLVSLDTMNSVSKEELIAKYEHVIVFSLKFFYQLAFRVKKQLDLIKEQCYGHPEALQDYIGGTSIFKDTQVEVNSRPNKNEKKNVVILPTNLTRRKTSSAANSPLPRDFALKPEESASSIKFQNINKFDLQEMYLGIFPGLPTIAQSFALGVLENTIMRYFLDNETVYKYLKDCKDQNSGQLSAIVNLSQLSILANRNLKKQLASTLESLSGLLLNTIASDKEISHIIDSKGMTTEMQILLIAKLRETEKGIGVVPNIADIKNFSDLVKTMMLCKFQNNPKPRLGLKEEYDAFVQRFQINEIKFNSPENIEDLPANADEDGSFEKTASEVSTARNQIDEESAIKTKTPRAFIKSKQHRPKMLNFGSVPALPKIEGKRDLLKEMKRIENSLISVKKSALGISKAEEETCISDDSFSPGNEEQKLPLISPKSEGRSFFLLKR
ncbi:unnamed protein product [Blepharisma stoltei]|uniref:Uncharacterized protein n=1 Tax=Blepharisma stoltei TaxID=1481888 RepID=A0AAU9JTY4_9CILI|nr:unnamed protein product [Blepharisma stoltei]